MAYSYDKREDLFHLLIIDFHFLISKQMKALKDLGLDVSKGTVSTEGPVKQTKFFITQS